jgi:hypothetical protein
LSQQPIHAGWKEILVPWNANIIDSEIMAVHAAFLNFDQLVYFGGDQHDADFNDAGMIDAIRLFDCNSFSVQKVHFDLFDAFCAGHALTYGGVLLVAGGTKDHPGGPGPHHEHFPGLRDAAVIRLDDHGKYQVRRVASMNRGLPHRDQPPPAEQIDPRSDSGGRWYPTLVTLPSGNVLALNGHPGTQDAWHENFIPEVFTPNPLPKGRWHRVGDPEDPAARAHFREHDSATLYPRAYVIPGGKVLVVSPSKAGKTEALTIDESTWKGQYQTVGDFTPLSTQRYGSYWESSVLLPISWDSTEARVLLLGAEDSWICTVPARPGIPLWRKTAPRQLANTPRRIHGLAVLLPNLKVLAVGGCAGPPLPPQLNVLDATAQRAPEIYDPEVNRDGATPGSWTALTQAAEREKQARNYHSTAILMRDGRVWVGGGNNDGIGGIANANLNIEVYEPAYYGNPNRPEILAAPDRWLTGTSFEVESTQVSENNIEHVIIIRCGSVTHAFNSDQRLIKLGFTKIGGDRLRVNAPKDASIAPPGFYFMFTVNKQNLPSLGIKVYITGIPLSEPERTWIALFAHRVGRSVMAQAWRLTFAYEGDEFTLVSLRKLVKRVPPGQQIEPDRSGRFVELRGANNEVLYRRSVDHIIPDTVEYPTGDPAQPLGRVAAPRHGEVAILVPAEPEGRSVAVVAVGRPPGMGERKTQKSAVADGPRDLIAVELPLVGEET